MSNVPRLTQRPRKRKPIRKREQWVWSSVSGVWMAPVSFHVGPFERKTTVGACVLQ